MKTLDLPLIVVNLKTYEQTMGEKAVTLGKIAEKVTKETGITIVLAPQYLDIPKLISNCNVPVFAQHIDGIDPGRGTGHILPETMKEAGVIGTILNHNERQLTITDIEAGIRRAKEVDLLTLVCSSNALVSVAVAALNPTYVAVEPPELIGTGISVSTAEPDIVTNTVKQIRDINQEVQILTGAGISYADDVDAALKLGTVGVLVASAVTKSRDPRSVLSSFAEAMLNHK